MSFFCPVHEEYSVFTCGGECREQRDEFVRIRHALDRYWRDRAAGKKRRGQVPAVKWHTRVRKMQRLAAQSLNPEATVDG